MRGLMALRQILELGCGRWSSGTGRCRRADEAFDDHDNLKDESQAAALKSHGPPARRTGTDA